MTRWLTQVPLFASPQDLSYLNRDLSKVVLLDTNPDHASLQPENAIIIPKWDGTPGDKGLIDMIPFLECESSARYRLSSMYEHSG